jgi:hypothetical protein
MRAALRASPEELADVERRQKAAQEANAANFRSRIAEREALKAEEEAAKKAADTPEARQRDAVKKATQRDLLTQVQLAARLGRTDAEISRLIGRSLTVDQVRMVREYYSLPEGKGGGSKPFKRGGAVLPAERASGVRADPKGLPLITRKQSGYAADRGKPDHHCGPDQKWPHGYCTKFRGPHACTEVAGFIAKHGGCTWWVAAETERQELKLGGAAPGPAPAEPSAPAHRPLIRIMETAQRADGGRIDKSLRIHGLDIVLEHAKGETSGNVKLPFAYGRTRGAAGERVDVMLGPHLKSEKVFVVDQEGMRPGAMVGFGSIAQARAHFIRAFPDSSGRKKLRGITEMSVDRFKAWLNGDTKAAVRAA